MLENMKSYRDSYLREKMERNRTLTQYLQLQFKPHFYMNSLTTIYALSRQQRKNGPMYTELSLRPVHVL